MYICNIYVYTYIYRYRYRYIYTHIYCVFPSTDDICDYFGVKIAMYFAWLGFYTTSMLYPAVIGFVLWMLTESDQVSEAVVRQKQPEAVT